MKYVSLITFAILFCTAISLGQPRPATAPTAPSTAVPPAKVALVFSSLFSNEKEGITKYIAALQQVDREFVPRGQELQALQNRLQILTEEIKKLTDATAIRAKQEEGERLNRALEFKQKDAQSAYQRRQGEVLGPLQSAIGKALQAFAEAEGITMILDGEKLGDNLLTMTLAIDVTRAFIKFFNQNNPR